MPVTRKSSRSSTGAGSGKQQTLSFKHKVTKSIQSGGKKDAFKSPSRSKEYIPEPSPEASPASPSPTTPATIDGKAEEGTGKEVQIPGNRRLERIEDQAQPALVTEPKSEAELRAQQITDNAIERYWSGIESSRMARAVHRKHTEGLSTGEKVLRYFDVSSQYGPCIGIPRVKRWQRAQRLGLNPPIEVLAVLLKEEGKGNKAIERAHMDELLNSTAVGSIGV